MADEKTYFTDDGQEVFVQMKHDKHDAVAQAVTLRAFDEVWSKKGWSIYNPSEADAQEVALASVAVDTATSKKGGK